MRDDTVRSFRRYKNGVLDTANFEKFETKINDDEEIVFAAAAKLTVTKRQTDDADKRKGNLVVTSVAVYIQQEAIWEEKVRRYPLQDMEDISCKVNQLTGAEFAFIFPDVTIDFPAAFNKKTAQDLHEVLIETVRTAKLEAETAALADDPVPEGADMPLVEDGAGPDTHNLVQEEPVQPEDENIQDNDVAPVESGGEISAESVDVPEPSHEADEARFVQELNVPPIPTRPGQDQPPVIMDVITQISMPMPAPPPKEEPKEEKASGEASVTAAFIADELLKLKGLLDAGLLTQSEFEEQKKKILSLR
mgnify:CR=1 FL=1